MVRQSKMYFLLNYLHETSKFSIIFSFSLCYIDHFPYDWTYAADGIIWINQNVWFYRQPLEVQCKIWVLRQNYLKPIGLIQFFISLALSLHMISNDMCQLKWTFCFLGCIWIVWLCVCVLYSSSWMVGLCYMNVITGPIFFKYLRHLTKDLSKGRWPLESNGLYLLGNTESFPSLLLCFPLLLFYFSSSLFPSLLQLWKCASCSQIMHLFSGSSDIWNMFP